MSITADELVVVIRDAIGGNLGDNAAAQEWNGASYAGAEHDLSRREFEVLELVTQGAGQSGDLDALYLSTNAVKTYIRSTYRKICVVTRSQAVLWAVRHVFSAPHIPDSSTDIDGVASKSALVPEASRRADRLLNPTTPVLGSR